MIQRDEYVRHRAQLVIKAICRLSGGKTYAPVGKLTTFRYLTSLAAGYRLAINHLDVTAFLNPHVDDPELYIELPNGWDSADGDCNHGDGLQQGDSNCDCGKCHCGDCHCGDGDCDSGNSNSGDSNSDYGSGIRPERSD